MKPHDGKQVPFVQVSPELHTSSAQQGWNCVPQGGGAALETPAWSSAPVTIEAASTMRISDVTSRSPARAAAYLTRTRPDQRRSLNSPPTTWRSEGETQPSRAIE
jgi:hypothetical protein